MSTLLEQASLVMIPSGYKEDIVYSQIPTNGSGDLSFTRASNGTRVNSAGLVEVCPWNLLQYSEDFTNAAWQGLNATITANDTTAPNGTLTADKFTSTSTTVEVQIRNATLTITPNVGQSYTTTIYAKKGTANFLRIRNLFVQNGGANGNAWFNLNTGVVGTVQSSQTASMEDAGNGWYRCILTGVVGSTNNYNLLDVGFTNTDATLFPSTSINGYIWGAQLNIGSTAKPYFPTTDRLNVPRLTYQNGGGGCPSLLLEKQSTNLVVQSQALSGSPWVIQTGSILDNNTISPDGTQNASKLTDITVYEGMSVDIGATYTATMYAKLGTATNICLVINNQAAWNTVGGVSFTTSNGLIANEWARVQFTFTAPATGAINLHIGGHGQTGVTPQSAGTVFVWGVQIEKSSYPTSYIPTTSASATRVADACSKTGISSLIGQTEGTVFWEGNFSRGSGTKKLFSLNDGSSTNLVDVYTTADNDIQARVRAGSNAYGVINTTVANSRFKLAYAYKNNDFVLYINGSQIGSVTSGSFSFSSPLTIIQVGDGESVVDELDGVVGEFVVFKTRIINTDLASLTA